MFEDAGSARGGMYNDRVGLVVTGLDGWDMSAVESKSYLLYAKIRLEPDKLPVKILEW